MNDLQNAIIINGETYVLDSNYDEGNDCENCALQEKCCSGTELICSMLHDAEMGTHYIKLEKQ